MTIVGITGLARAGKDTVAAVLVEQGYTRLGFADQLKALALAIDPIIYEAEVSHDGLWAVRLSEVVSEFGYEIAKDQYPEVRRFLQSLGTEARNFLGSDVWIDAWKRALPTTLDYSSHTNPQGVVRTSARIRELDTVTPDVRFLNEAAAIKDLGGLIIRVVRDGSGLAGTAGQHPSELEQADIDADVTILNNGTLEELKNVVLNVLEYDLGTAA